MDRLRELRRPLAALTLGGLALRILWVMLEPATQPIADERTWTNWAIENLLSRKVGLNPLRTHMIFYPPVYPYFIAVVFAPFGTLTAVKLAQSVVGALLVPAVGRVGALLFGARAGLVAAAVAAFYPDLVWFSAHFWSETVFLTVLWWAIERLLVADRQASTPLAAFAGVVWGLSILVRETALYLTPLVALWLAFGRRRDGGRARGALFLAAALATVAPWTVRNAVIFPGAFVPVSTAGGLNLWQGNAKLTRQEVYDLYEQVHGRVEQYRHARRMGLAAIWERQPTWLLEKLEAEMPQFWEADSLALIHIRRGAYGRYWPAAAVTAAAVIVLPYLAVLGFALLGVASLRPDRGRVLLLGFLVLYNGLHIVTHGFARYRLPIMPVLFVLAAAAFVAWRSGALPKLGRGRVALAGALAVGVAVTLAPSARTLVTHPAYDLSRPFTPPPPGPA